MMTMYANALYRRGFVEEGYRAIHTLYEQAVNFEVSRIYPGIPEYFNDRGRGMYHYLTGAASWIMLTVITEMFGVKGKCGDLVLEPKLRKEQFHEGRAGINLNFGKRRWHIVYVNAGGKESGSYRIANVQLDGKKRESASVSLEEINQLIGQVENRELLRRFAEKSWMQPTMTGKNRNPKKLSRTCADISGQKLRIIILMRTASILIWIMCCAAASRCCWRRIRYSMYIPENMGIWSATTTFSVCFLNFIHRGTATSAM